MTYCVPAGGYRSLVVGWGRCYSVCHLGDRPPAFFHSLALLYVFRGCGWIIIEYDSAIVFKEVTTMEVVFTQDVLNQAQAGEIKRVADGFARNYLIPQGLAQVATPEVLKRLHKIKAAGDETRIQETQDMRELASTLDGTTVTITARVTPTGRYYGAITNTRMASELAAAVGRDIDRRLLDSAESIREPGEYDVVLRFSGEIEATIHIAAEIEE